MTNLKWVVPALVLVAAAAFYLTKVGGGSGASGVAQSQIIQEATPEKILDFVRAQKSPVVLVNFWASWCEPCKEEFPLILNLKRDMAAQGLRVVFVSIDEPADVTAAESFLKQQQVDFLTFYKGSQALSFVSQIYPQWNGAVPATILMGPDLKILDAWEGDASKGEFESRVQKFLKGT